MFREIALKEMVEANGIAATVLKLSEAIEDGEIKADDFSLRRLAEGLVGEDWVRRMDPRLVGNQVELLEAGNAVDSTAFANITGQLVFSTIKEQYKMAAFIADGLCSTIPTTLSGEKIPSIQNLGSGDEGNVEVKEGMPYPRAGFGEHYIETPDTKKYGMIVPVTKEAIFFDRTGLVLRTAGQVGERLALGKEKRVLKTVLGIDNSYSENGTSYNTFQTATPWINDVAAGAELLDWTDIDEAEQLFTNITDPATGEPILITPDLLLVMPAKVNTANMILRAAQVETRTATSAIGTWGNNPLGGKGYGILASPIARAALVASGVAAATADKYWYFGSPKKAFAYMENWGLAVQSAPTNNVEEWDRDIVAQFKASERGVIAVTDPRYWQRRKP